LLLGCTSSVTSERNRYTFFTDDVKGGELSKNNLLTTLPVLYRDWDVTFDIKPSEFTPGWKNIIHLTTGQDLAEHGSRTPAVWFHYQPSGKLNRFYISSDVSGNKDHIHTTKLVPLNKWITVRITQFQSGQRGQYEYSIFLDGERVYKVTNTWATVSRKVKVYASSPWYDAQKGKIRNLVINTYTPRSEKTSEYTLGKTGWGYWRKPAMCPTGVYGFRLQVEAGGRDNWDDSALNGIELVCKDGKKQQIKGDHGRWKNWKFCKRGQHMIGLNFRSEHDQDDGDDTAGNNVQMRCTDDQVLDGEGERWGRWDGWKICPGRSFMCGVEAKIEQHHGHRYDDTGLNQVKLICCTSPSFIVGFTYGQLNDASYATVPEVLGTIEIKNECATEHLGVCQPQRKSFHIDRSTTTVRSWDHSAGVSITLGTTIDAGVPFFVGGEITASVTGSYTHKWGSKVQQKKSWKSTDTCIAAPGFKVTCKFMITKSTLSVPFTALWSNGEVTYGQYNGIDFLHGKMDVKRTYLN